MADTWLKKAGKKFNKKGKIVAKSNKLQQGEKFVINPISKTFTGYIKTSTYTR